MPTPVARSYTLTPEHVAHHGGEVVALAASAGGAYRLHARRPDASINRRLTRASLAAFAARGASVGFDGSGLLEPVDDGPSVAVVVVSGPIMYRAGAPEPCAMWVDGHDAIAERLIAAMRSCPIVLGIFDTPGGAVAGGQTAIDRVLEAKAETGARIIVAAHEMIGSMGVWWAASIADEIYLPRRGVIGAIGVRAQHNSNAGALAKDGIVPTFSYWPDEGKIAGVEELPLSDLGKARMDVMARDAGEAFGAAVCGGPVGLSAGLDVARVVAMRADAYTGEAAVKAGLATGVAPLQDVMRYALALAGAKSERTTAMADPEKDPEKKDDDTDEETALGTQPDGVCKSCGTGNALENKFCAQCGVSMAAPPIEDAPKSDRAPADPPGKASARVSTSFEGLTSTAAMKAEIIRLRGKIAAFLGLADKASVADALGVFKAQADDARAAGRLRTERDQARQENEDRERIALLLALTKADPSGYPRGELVSDVVNEKTNTRTGVRPASGAKSNPIVRAPIAELRSFVQAKRATASKAPDRSPYNPDHAAAENAARQTAGSVFAPLTHQTGLNAKVLTEAETYINNMIGAGQAAENGL